MFARKPSPLNALTIISRSRLLERSQWFFGVSGEKKKLLLAWSLIILAGLLHFICCNWRMPDENFFTTGKFYCVACDNQIFGMIHAGRLFRYYEYGVSFYKMEGACLLGVALPLLIAYPGVMAILSTYLPPEYVNTFHKIKRKLLISRTSPASAVSLMFLILLGATTVTGAVTTAIPIRMIEVKPEKDSVALADHEIPARASVNPSSLQDDTSSTWLCSSSPSGCRSSSPASVPEPGTWILILLAAGSLGIAKAWSHFRARS
jgi:MFS family permease